MKKIILALAAFAALATPAVAQNPHWIQGEYTLAAGPLNLEDNFAASNNIHQVVWVTDRPGGAGFMVSNGIAWVSDQGPKGDDGAQGPRGEQGVAGPAGLNGADGATGAQGPKGDDGAVGPQGPKGDEGAQGPKGDKGDTGEQGPAGLSAVVASNVSRTLDSAFTISATRPALVAYTVKSTVTTTLLIASASATAYLEYSTDSGASWITASDTGASLDGVSVAIGQVIRGRYVLTGTIPAGASVRIRSEVTGSGTGTLEYVRGQEVLI